MTEPVAPLTDETRNKAGRPKGAKNKLPQKLKEALMRAFERAGGETYLHQVALDDPKTFCALLGKILPAELKLEGAGPQGEHLHKIERTVVDPKPRNPDA
jgi:hypothetical protein